MRSRGSAAKAAVVAVALAAALGGAIAWRFGGGAASPTAVPAPLPGTTPASVPKPPVVIPKPPDDPPRPTSLFGKVMDATGKPVANARFYFLPETNDGQSLFQRLDAMSDVDGDYNLKAGSILLAAWAPGQGLAVIDLTSQPVGERNITLPSGGCAVRGRVRDAEGRPVGGAVVGLSWISAISPAGESQLAFAGPDGSHLGNDNLFAWGALPATEKPPSVATATDGTFELKGLPAGSGIRVDARGFAAANIPIPASGDVDVTLEPEK